MIVNNSTYINKINNHLSHSNSLNINKTTTYDIGNPGPGLGQTQKCGRFKSVNPNPPSLIIGFPMTIQILKKKTIKKFAQICFHSKRLHTITKMNLVIKLFSVIKQRSFLTSSHPIISQLTFTCSHIHFFVYIA